MDKDLVGLYSWIIRGKQRRIIIKNLDGIRTPTQIKEETKLGLNNVSDILRLFVKMGFIISDTKTLVSLVKKFLEENYEFIEKD